MRRERRRSTSRRWRMRRSPSRRPSPASGASSSATAPPSWWGCCPVAGKAHVEGLTRAYFDQRRDAVKLVRSDLAQGWTSYIQGQEASARRDGERAIASWIVGGQVPEYAAE